MRIEAAPSTGCISGIQVHPETIREHSIRKPGNQILRRAYQPTVVSLPHGQEEHLLYCSSGRQEEHKPVCSRLRVEGHVYEWHDLPDKAITFIPAGFPFEWEWTYNTTSIHLLISPAILRHLAIEMNPRPSAGELLPQFRIHDSFAETLLSQLGLEISGHGYGTTLAMDALTNLLSMHILRTYAGRSTSCLSVQSAGLTQQQKAVLMIYIEENLSENIRLQDMAEVVGLSQFHFARLFKAAFGQSPHEYQLQRRIHRACGMLQTQPEDTLAKVATSFGFADESHFRRHFKRIIGVTPGHYRKEFQR